MTMHQVGFRVEPNSATAAVWAARGPSLWTRRDNEPPEVDHGEPIPKRPTVPGSTHKLIVDLDGIVAMRREGYEWAAIAEKFGVSSRTCQSRAAVVAPELIGKGIRGKKAPKAEA